MKRQFFAGCALAIGIQIFCPACATGMVVQDMGKFRKSHVENCSFPVLANEECFDDSVKVSGMIASISAFGEPELLGNGVLNWGESAFGAMEFSIPLLLDDSPVLSVAPKPNELQIKLARLHMSGAGVFAYDHDDADSWLRWKLKVLDSFVCFRIVWSDWVLSALNAMNISSPEEYAVTQLAVKLFTKSS